MILNPPEIFLVLKSYRNALRIGASGTVLEDMLAIIFARFIGHPPYETFLRIYQLYLQSIPLDLAKAAWGINAAQQSTPTHHSLP
jgi:hypothetical protein